MKNTYMKNLLLVNNNNSNVIPTTIISMRLGKMFLYIYKIIQSSLYYILTSPGDKDEVLLFCWNADGVHCAMMLTFTLLKVLRDA